MFWNLICCALLWLRVRYLGANGDDIFFADGSVNFRNFLKGFCLKYPYPYAFAFWFIRNLMVFVVLSPIIRLIARSVLLTLLFVIAYKYFNLERLMFVSGMIWFVVGAFLAYHKKLIPPIGCKYFYVALVAFAALAALCQVVDCKDLLFIVIMYLVSFVGLYLKRKFGQNRLFIFAVSSTFMIYATHQCYSRWLCETVTNKIGSGLPCVPVLVYVLCVGIMVAAGFAINYLLRRFTPRLCEFITGGT